MPTDTCDFPGCENPIAQKCASCSQAFCPRHSQLEIHGSEYRTHGSYICDVCRVLRNKRNNLPVRGVTVVIVQEPASSVLAHCVRALQVGGAKVVNPHSTVGEIKADVKGSLMAGPGETITISTMDSAGKDLFVFIESKAKWPTQTFDLLGRNERNITSVIAELSKHVQLRRWPV